MMSFIVYVCSVCVLCRDETRRVASAQRGQTCSSAVPLTNVILSVVDSMVWMIRLEVFPTEPSDVTLTCQEFSVTMTSFAFNVSSHTVEVKVDSKLIFV